MFRHNSLPTSTFVYAKRAALQGPQTRRHHWGIALVLLIVTNAGSAFGSRSFAAENSVGSVQNGWVLLRNGDAKGVAQLAQKKIKAGEHRAQWYELLALANEAQSSDQTTHAAIAAEAVKLEPKNAHMLSTYAWLCPQPGSALQYAKRAVSIAPADGRAHVIMGVCLWRLKQDDAAIDELKQAIKIAPADFDVNLLAGQLYRDKLDEESARGCFARLVSNFPKSPYAWLLRGDFLRSAEQPEEAIKDYSRAIAIDKNSLPALWARAKVYQVQKRYAESIADCTRCIALDPNYEYFQTRAECYQSLNQYKKAIDEYSEAIKALAGGLPHADRTFAPEKTLDRKTYLRDWVRRAELCELDSQMELALEEVGQMLHTLPNDYRPLDIRQRILIKLGRYQEALPDLNRLVKLQPYRSDWYRARAEVFTKLGRASEASADKARAKQTEGTRF